MGRKLILHLNFKLSIVILNLLNCNVIWIGTFVLVILEESNTTISSFPKHSSERKPWQLKSRNLLLPHVENIILYHKKHALDRLIEEHYTILCQVLRKELQDHSRLLAKKEYKFDQESSSIYGEERHFAYRNHRFLLIRLFPNSSGQYVFYSFLSNFQTTFFAFTFFSLQAALIFLAHVL